MTSSSSESVRADQILTHIAVHIREHFRRLFLCKKTENERSLFLVQLLHRINDIDRMYGLQFLFQLFKIMFLQKLRHLFYIKFSVLTHATHPLYDIFVY